MLKDMSLYNYHVSLALPIERVQALTPATKKEEKKGSRRTIVKKLGNNIQRVSPFS